MLQHKLYNINFANLLTIQMFIKMINNFDWARIIFKQLKLLSHHIRLSHTLTHSD